MLVSWLLKHMGKERRSPAVMVCLLPLLQLCMKVCPLSMDSFIDTCCQATFW